MITLIMNAFSPIVTPNDMPESCEQPTPTPTLSPTPSPIPTPTLTVKIETSKYLI